MKQMSGLVRVVFLSTAAVAITCLLVPGTRAGEVKLQFLSSGVVSKVGSYIPRQVALSETRPAGLIKAPTGLAAPLYAVLKLGAEESPTSFFIVVDEPEGQPARLFVDANANGDLTDDADAEWIPKTSKHASGRELVMFSGGATFKVPYGNQTLDLHMVMNRFDKNDPERAGLKAVLLYYSDYAYSGEVVLEGTSYQALIVDSLATGDFRKRGSVRLYLDLNGDGKFLGQPEMFGVSFPYKDGSTTHVYEVAALSAAGGTFRVAKLGQSVEKRMPVPSLPAAADAQGYVRNISILVKPMRGPETVVNDLVLAYVAQLAEAQQAGFAPDEVAAKAVAVTTLNEEWRKLTTETMLRNLKMAEGLGCLDAEGLAKMRNGEAPTVRIGPYQGDLLNVDQIIPRTVCEHLHNNFANLELAPQKMIERKGGKIGKRELDLARKLSKAGLMETRDMMEIEDRAATGR